jgi:hypothetical protein
MAQANAEAVFKAAYARMKHADQKAILGAQERCWAEQLNGNAGSQGRADVLFDEAVSTAFSRMLPSDLAYVESLLA